MENIIMGMGNYDKIIKKEPEVKPKENLLDYFDNVEKYIKGRLPHVNVLIYTDSWVHDNNKPDKVIIRIKWKNNDQECGYESCIDRYELVTAIAPTTLILNIANDMIEEVKTHRSLNGG